MLTALALALRGNQFRAKFEFNGKVGASKTPSPNRNTASIGKVVAVAVSKVIREKPPMLAVPIVRAPNFCIKTPKTRMTRVIDQAKAERMNPIWVSLAPISFWISPLTTDSVARSR